ncbi:flagellar biosynthesis protein FlgI [Cognatishimia sp.]|uniref:flagellar biosynthesis protein FlgI n=1 Tax=Cognatishimia sp. TaxID=2211648 RepID=UPI003BAAF94A
MIATRQFRMSERKQSRTGAADDPSPMDLQNIDAFAEKIKEAVALLRSEIEAINAGNLDVVSDKYEEKSGLLKWLELKRPLVEPFIKKDAALARRLPELLEDLRVAVTENSTLLSRMAGAAGSVAREIEKATQRHSLNGLYGKSGKKVGDSTVTKMTIDREF